MRRWSELSRFYERFFGLTIEYIFSTFRIWFIVISYLISCDDLTLMYLRFWHCIFNYITELNNMYFLKMMLSYNVRQMRHKFFKRKCKIPPPHQFLVTKFTVGSQSPQTHFFSVGSQGVCKHQQSLKCSLNCVSIWK